jgi:hypothetical protein
MDLEEGRFALIVPSRKASAEEPTRCSEPVGRDDLPALRVVQFRDVQNGHADRDTLDELPIGSEAFGEWVCRLFLHNDRLSPSRVRE